MNTITIGPTATRLLARSGSSQAILDAQDVARISRSPVKRLGQPEEVAKFPGSPMGTAASTPTTAFREPSNKRATQSRRCSKPHATDRQTKRESNRHQCHCLPVRNARLQCVRARPRHRLPHTYSATWRGVEFLMAIPILDRAPKGRDEGAAFQLWIRRHDEDQQDTR